MQGNAWNAPVKMVECFVFDMSQEYTENEGSKRAYILFIASHGLAFRNKSIKIHFVKKVKKEEYYLLFSINLLWEGKNIFFQICRYFWSNLGLLKRPYFLEKWNEIRLN